MNLTPRAFGSVVGNSTSTPPGLHLPIKFLTRLAEPLLIHIGHREDDFKGRNGLREGRPVSVHILLNGSRQDPLKPNAVGPHKKVDLFTGGVEYGSTHGL